MGFWDERDLPFTYSLARHFPIGQRYFCSVLAQTYPNRRFLFTGTASGTIATDSDTFSIPAANGTICDRLDAHHIDWAIYYQNLPSWLIVPGSLDRRARRRASASSTAFAADVAAGRLPQFTFIDPNYDTTSEENPQDIQVGERFIAEVVHTLMQAPDLEAHRAVHHLRRARRLLRPRAAAARDQARQRSRRCSTPGDVRARTTATGSGCRCSSSRPGPSELRLEHRPGPHLGAGVHRAQVEPPGDDVPRRQRAPDDRLLRLPQARRSPSRPRWPRHRRWRPGIAELPRARAQAAALRTRRSSKPRQLLGGAAGQARTRQRPRGVAAGALARGGRHRDLGRRRLLGAEHFLLGTCRRAAPRTPPSRSSRA